MADFQDILFGISEGVATITLSRPDALNSISQTMLNDLSAALDQVEDPKAGIRCLVITGAGRAYCAGADLASGMGAPSDGPIDAGRTLETDYNPLIERLTKLPCPLVTAVNGVAAGAGMSFAIVGDIVLAAKSAYFLQAFINIGLVPDAGSSYMLPRLIGKARAQAVMMLGERMPAEQALDWGMIYAVYEDDQLLDAAQAMARRLADGPTVAHGLIRNLVRQSPDNSLTEQLRLERELQKAAGRTEDFVEGVSAFLQKRKAAFKGR